MGAFFQINVLGMQVDVPTKSDVHPAFADLLDRYKKSEDSECIDDMVALARAFPKDHTIPAIVLPILVQKNQVARALEFGRTIPAQLHNNPLIAVLFGDVLQRSGEHDEAVFTLVRGFCLRLGVEAELPSAEVRDTLFFDAVKAVCEQNPQALSDPMLHAAGAALGRSDYFDHMKERLGRIDYLSFLADKNLSPNIPMEEVNSLSAFFGFCTSPSLSWRTLLLDNLIVPAMERCRDLALYDQLLSLEIWTYLHYVRFEETEDHYRQSFQKMRLALEGAGLDFAKLHPFTPVAASDTSGPTKVAIIINNHAWMAHVIVMLEIIECLQAHDPKAFEFHILAIRNNANLRLVDRCKELNVKVWSVSEHSDGPGASKDMLALRSLCEQIEAKVCIWTSTAANCYFAYAFRIAPVQIYFSMKYKTVAPDYADGLLALHSVAEPIKTYGGIEWRMGRMYLTDLYDADLEADALAVREQFKDFSTILGCIGRAEKINSPEFLAVVAGLLRDNPQAVFLWTGLDAMPSINAQFKEAGVLEQTAFVGWVNTKVYAQVLDVFLDSFPFPCGRTAFEAMVAKKPVVFYRSEEALSTGIIMTVDPLLNGDLGEKEDRDLMKEIFADDDGRTLMPIADSPEQFRSYAQDLIDSHELRTLTGTAQGRFVESFMCNKVATGKIYHNHINHIIDNNK